jgi:AcrR family transcriptional regulator
VNKSLDRTITVTSGPPTARGAATRQRIIEATIEVIAERGWAAVTTREVARRAGVQQAQLGYHFGSKDGLLRAAIVTAFDEMMAAMGDQLSGPPDQALDFGALLGGLHAADADTRLTLVGAEALSLSLRDPELGAWMRDELARLRDTLADRLRSARDAGAFRTDLEPDAVAVLLAALLDGLLLYRAVDPALDLRSAARALDALLAPGTGTEQGRRNR